MPPRSSILLAAALTVLALGVPAAAEPASSGLTVSIDHARVLKIDHPAETIIIGNPSIVDVSIHDASTLILTGRSFGVTNLVVLDANGDPVVDESVIVNAVETASVRVYRQSQRTSYSCSPNCQPTVTVGDTDTSFAGAAGQFGMREQLSRSQ